MPDYLRLPNYPHHMELDEIWLPGVPHGLFCQTLEQLEQYARDLAALRPRGWKKEATEVASLIHQANGFTFEPEMYGRLISWHARAKAALLGDIRLRRASS